MAVAAYAYLVSLTHVLDNLHYRARFHLPLVDMKQIDMLQENVQSLLEFVELHSERPEIVSIWRKLAQTAFEAEDMINFHVVNLLGMRYQGETSDAYFLPLCETMEEVHQKLCFIKEELPAIKEEEEDIHAGKQPGAFLPSAGGSSTASSGDMDVVVGLDKHVVSVMDKLTRNKSKLQIFSIVGMGGIGKTTLAKSVFNHPHIVNYFDECIWLTISQGYSAEHILKAQLEEWGNKEEYKTFMELGERFHKNIFGSRYLIVMDDIWTTKVWDDLKRFFPDNENGSCIILTTRLSNMATSLSSYNPYELTFMDEEMSWELFCQNAFAQTGCPYKCLEKVAKDIVKSCRGLPLEIVVISRMLANSNMTIKHWEDVAENINSYGSLEDDEHCLRSLYLSYKSLPIHLKPCFLYMRVFFEDEWISDRKLMDFWIAEGFIKPASDQSMEEIAMKYLKGLKDRNLIFSRSTTASGIHDLLLELCLRESRNECFLQSAKVQCVDLGLLCSLCRKQFSHAVHILGQFHIFTSSSKCKYFVCGACKMVYSHTAGPSFEGTTDGYFYRATWQEKLVRYAYVALSSFTSMCPGVHLLWNLQSLVFTRNGSGGILLPPHIWDMPQLRHIICELGNLLVTPVTATRTDGEEFLVLKNLQTLSPVANFNCTKETLDRIPNLKKLDICYEDELEGGMQQLNYSLCNLEQLQSLESLDVMGAFEKITFPSSLKILALRNCRMAWEDMSILGSLPRLESLQLCQSMEGVEWNPVEGEFPHLELLVIFCGDLVCWRANDIPFPVLKHLKLYDLHSLEEIPSVIGDIPTLESIVLSGCSESCIISAKKIWAEQKDMENDIRIDVVDKGGVSYRIGPITQRMTTVACASLAYLKRILNRLEKAVQHAGGIYLNTTQLEIAEEGIHFLRDFVQVHSRNKIQRMENLLSEIAQVDREATVVIQGLRERVVDDKLPAGQVVRLLEKMELIKRELSVEVGARYESLQADATDHDADARNYDIESLRIDDDIDSRYDGTGTVTACFSYGDLGCTMELLKEAAEIGRYQLNTKQMEMIEETIHFLQDVVEVHGHPRSESQAMESLSREISDVADAARSMISRQNCRLYKGDKTGEEFFSDVERVIEKIELIRKQLPAAVEEEEEEEEYVQGRNQTLQIDDHVTDEEDARSS